jgi:hypothetical protein
MRLSELLIGAKLASPKEVEAALLQQTREGGNLGEILVSTGIIKQKTLDRLMRVSPPAAGRMVDLQIKENDLLDLLMKILFVHGVEDIPQISNAIKLSQATTTELMELALARHFVKVTGARGVGALAERRYELTEEGRERAGAAIARSQYVGPCPVSLDDFKKHVLLQRIANERVSQTDINSALAGLCINEGLVTRIGPALNSGRPILFYGPPGNGKTSIALRLGRILSHATYVPYAVLIEGQVMRVFDSKLHTSLTVKEAVTGSAVKSLRDVEFDERWVPCLQPFVVAGGELTLEMLELGYDPTAKFYEAPLHVKALGGSILIDDFGRQLVSPSSLLNRWIVPLESGIDFLKLQTGKSFELPFEVRVMFSTNLEPDDLMDSAFLRRIPFKLEIAPPTPDQFKTIFAQSAKGRNIPVPDGLLDYLVDELVTKRGIEIAAYQPEFIVDQALLACDFEGSEPHLETRLIDAAIANIKVTRYRPPKPG